MTWRELRTFVRHLPRDSAYGRAELGEEAEWDQRTHLLARIANETAAANYQRASKKMPPGEVIKPPGQAKAKAQANGHQKTLGWDELNAAFD